MTRAIPRQESLIAPEIQNPFVHKINFGYLDLIQIGLMSVTIAPVRLLLVVTCFLLAWPLAAIALAFRSEEDKQKPLSGWRNMFRPLIVFLSRLVFFTGGFHRVCIKGKLAPPSEAPILAMGPHSSYFDALPIVFLNLTSVVTKVENGNVPLLGSILLLFCMVAFCFCFGDENSSVL